MAIEIVDLPIQNGGSFHRFFVCLPGRVIGFVWGHAFISNNSSMNIALRPRPSEIFFVVWCRRWNELHTTMMVTIGYDNRMVIINKNHQQLISIATHWYPHFDRIFPKKHNFEWCWTSLLNLATCQRRTRQCFSTPSLWNSPYRQCNRICIGHNLFHPYSLFRSLILLSHCDWKTEWPAGKIVDCHADYFLTIHWNIVSFQFAVWLKMMIFTRDVNQKIEKWPKGSNSTFNQHIDYSHTVHFLLSRFFVF